MATADLPIDALLADLGYRDTDAKRAARAVLQAAGLTNARKTRIATHKLDAIKSALSTRLVIVCAKPTCRAALEGDARTIVLATDATHCAVCGGSANRAEIDRAIARTGGSCDRAQLHQRVASMGPLIDERRRRDLHRHDL